MLVTETTFIRNHGEVDFGHFYKQPQTNAVG